MMEARATFTLGQGPRLPLHLLAKRIAPETLALWQSDLAVTVQLLHHLRQRNRGNRQPRYPGVD